MRWSRRLTLDARQEPKTSYTTRIAGLNMLLLVASAGLAEAEIESSVGSVGDSYDNALAETINGLFKTEVIHRRGPWRLFDAVEPDQMAVARL